MLDAALLRELRQIVGAEHVAWRQSDAEVYSYDGSLAVAKPDAVVFPADTAQTAAVVRLASEAGVAYVPRGFGTNLSGGTIASHGGLVIGLTRLNRILAIEPEGRYAVVQAGVTNLELQQALAPRGFLFAPDPASQKAATLGGNLAENAGGPHCVKYGVTTNHVLGVTAVLPGGAVLQIGGPALDPPGYDLRGVLVGSEGTLAVVTEMTVRILPSAESLLTMLVVYDDVADAARSVSAIVAAGMTPATLEMMDGAVIRAVEASKPCGYPLDAAAVLIVEVDGPLAGLAQQAERIGQLCLQNGCREVRKAKDAAERDLLWAGRRGAFGAIARLAPSFLVADCTVPRTRLPDALTHVAAIAQRYQLGHANVFHAGDGNLHPVILFDPRDPGQVQRVHRAGHEIMEACVALGGTISGEHGVGTEKLDGMRLVFSEDDLEFQRQLRTAFDPQGLLNPGKLLPPPEAVPCPPEPAPPEPGDDSEWAPSDVSEACDIVRRAYQGRRAVLPLGNGTQSDFGNWGASAAAPLRSTRLTAVTEYDPATEVVGVQAGLSLSQLQATLAEHGQWLPLRPPLGERRTLGGIAALNACGPERLRYGAPRDLLLGLKFISGSGRQISAGGRVMKNVAGYDVSAGTLGFITELTFRIQSVPACCVAVRGGGSLEQIEAAAGWLLQSKLEPNFIVVLPDPAQGLPMAASPSDADSVRGASGPRWQLVAGFEGFRETVDAQVEGCRGGLTQQGLSAAPSWEYPAKAGICQGRFETLYRAPFVLRMDLPPNRIVELLSNWQELTRKSELLVDWGCGRLTAGLADLAADAWPLWHAAAAALDATVVLEKAPDGFRQEQDVFGPPRADWELTHKIKLALDPHEILAPGRLPGRR
ncbi:MAG: FAD-binding protein [Pirellulaceae bacterium]|nr:FAD-binding protein [Pirellulaceae bacterium]